MTFEKILSDHKKWLFSQGKVGSRAVLKGDLRRVNLRGANLREAILDGVNLKNSDLRNATLNKAVLKGDLRGANLQEAWLENAKLRGVDFRSATLCEATLNWADLRNAKLQGANLRGANLTGAILHRSKLDGAILLDTNIFGCSGNGKEIKSIFCSGDYPITYTSTHLQIGCERHPIKDWWSGGRMIMAERGGEKALKFWNQWKEILQAIINKSPATK